MYHDVNKTASPRNKRSTLVYCRKRIKTGMDATLCIERFTSSVSINKEYTLPINSSECRVTSLKTNDQLSTEIKVILGSLYIIASLLGTVGNLLAIFTILLRKQMQTTRNLLLLNLSISDLIVTAICMPIYFRYQALVYPIWPYNELTCKIFKYLLQLSVFCSVLTLVTISLHRYFLMQRISNVFSNCITKWHMFLWYWICALLFTIPTGAATELVFVTSRSSCKHLCIEVYSTRQSETIHLLLRVVTYLLSVTILCALQCWIAFKLCKNSLPASDQLRIHERNVAAKLLLMAAAVFFLCWLPYALHIILAIFPPSRDYELNRSHEITGNFLGMANSALNPYIYCCYSKRFRSGFRSILKFFRCVPAFRSNRVQPHEKVSEGDV